MISLTSPVRTRAHDWPAGAKLAALSVVTIWLFFVESLAVQAGVCLFVLLLYAAPGRRFLAGGLRNLWVLWPFVAIVAVWHLWTFELKAGAVIILRMISAVGLANLVTMTTRLSDMIDVVALLLRPFARLGLSTRVVEVSVALVIRLTPVLILKGKSLTEAWRARARRRAGWRIILPFVVLALDDADHVAEALRARGGLALPKDR